MAALHSALQSLSPTSFDSVPRAESEIKDYLQDAFAKAQLILDSVPPPSTDSTIAATRSRSNTTTSGVSATSEMSVSSARSDPIDPSHVYLQKEWGKPVKLAAKDNPLGMAVYKMAGKDGKGAWFARSSVHEGMGFKKWKLGLQKEFPESMEVQGGPGEGNIRGIGGERRVETIGVQGVGTVEVYHLSAQFPGPTAPRDFVTLLITSSSALGNSVSSISADGPGSSQFDLVPRHFMVISKPCIHPDCPPREGFIRGQYESVEFIREIPQRPKRVSSTNELLKKAGRARATSSSLDRVARLRSAHESIDQSERESVLTADTRTGDDSRLSLDDSASRTGRQRGRTISFAESRGLSAKGEAVDTCNDESDELEETNPVEWIMVTRSDPGGSVPRFLVERGTPSGIVADASKFLDWAIKKEHEEPRNEDLETEEHDMKNANASHNVDQDLEAYQTNGHLAGLNGASEEESIKTSPIPAIEEPAGFPELENSDQNHQEGLLASVTNIALPSIESYAPQIVIDRLANHHTSPSVLADARSPSASVNTGSEVNDANMTHTTQDRGEPESISSSSSIVSFASAEDHFEDAFSRQATSSLTDPLDGTSAAMSPHDKELTKLIERKKILDEKLAKTREKELKDKEEITSREEERLRKAEEKHAREIQKQEEKYKKEVAKLEAKRAKDAAKEEERKRKAEEKDEKARLTREKEEFKQLLAVVSKERDILKEQVGALQRENTALVAKMGKMGEGQDLLREVKSEMLGGVRSRSGSLRKARPASPVLGPAPTVLAGGKQEPKNEPSPLSDT